MNKAEWVRGKPSKKTRWEPPYVVKILHLPFSLRREHPNVIGELAVATKHLPSVNSIEVMLPDGHLVKILDAEVERQKSLDNETETFLINYFQELLGKVQKEEQEFQSKKKVATEAMEKAIRE